MPRNCLARRRRTVWNNGPVELEISCHRIPALISDASHDFSLEDEMQRKYHIRRKACVSMSMILYP
jgi:hypothetical protein